MFYGTSVMSDPQTPEEIVEHLTDFTDRQRAEWLDAHCADASVRRLVEERLRELDEEILREEGEADGWLNLPDLIADNEYAELPGEIGGFTILSVLGRGGMGVVYLARDPDIDRPVALKTVTSEFARRRFAREAEALGRLRHPGIVSVFRFEPHGPTPFLVMEYLAGDTLEAQLAVERARDVDVADVQRQRGHVARLADIADALQYAHEEGVIHRDVKPSNIMIDPDGRARLTDFGVAKLLDSEQVTRTGDHPGTYRYMSPEQAALAAHDAVDRRSDVFSLGVVLYECLTLVPAFTGKTVEQVLQSVIESEPRSLESQVRGISEDLAAVCYKALEKNPKQRYAAASQFAEDLRAWLRGDPVMARRVSWIQRKLRGLRRHAVGLWVASALAAALVGGAFFEQWRSRPSGRLDVQVFTQAVVDPDTRVTLTIERVDNGEIVESTTLAWRTVESFSLAPGQYRLRALTSDGWFADTLVTLAAEEARVFPMCLVRESADDEAMVLVPAEGDELAFMIDKTEVSNDQFASFLSAQPPEVAHRLRPPWWTDDGPGLAGDLAVTGMTLEACECFAAWAGKRLPTADEWVRAVRGENGWPVPWGPDVPASPECFANAVRLNGGHAPMRDVGEGANIADARRMLAAELQPVGDPRPRAEIGCEENADRALRDETPAGILHLYGNVIERTSTPHPRGTGDEYVALGRGWGLFRADTEIIDVRADGTRRSAFGVPAGERRLGLGFRCARSVGRID